MAVLTPHEYAILHLILQLRRELKRTKSEPEFVLPQNYIRTFLSCSPNTVVSAINHLCSLKILTPTVSKFGECTSYQFNTRAYNALIRKAKTTELTLFTGRSKTKQKVTSETILQYMIGKSIAKARKGA